MRAFVPAVKNPWTIAGLSVIGAMVVALGEQDRQTLPFVLGIFSAIVLTLVIFSRRPIFSLYVGWTLLGTVTAISATKMKFMAVSLHAFDVYFYFRDLTVAEFVLGAYLLPALACVSVPVSGGLLCWLVYRAEPKRRIGATQPVLGLSAAIMLVGVTFPRLQPDDTRFYFGLHFSSSFFTSLRDIGYLLSDTDFTARLSVVSSPATYSGNVDCNPTQSKPDIVVALMESAMPPSIFPALKVPSALSQSFHSPDGHLRLLKVNTFGGATWISATGMLTSLPTAEFGWMRPYLPYFLNGRVHYSLPKLLKRCGYKTAAISPMAYPFVNEGPFLTSLGIDDYRDYKAIGAKSKQERDAVYFQAALKYLAEHRKSDPRPVFLLVSTMAAHGPYASRLFPDVRVDGEPFGNGREMDEYLRRLTLQRIDFDGFVGQMKDSAGPNGTVIVDFGDHQPVTTKSLAAGKPGEPVGREESSLFHTYYRITAVGRASIAPPPTFPLLDIAYLGPTLLQAAGVPTDDVYRELIHLRDHCRGAFDDCRDRARIALHLKKLANSGLLDLSQQAVGGHARGTVEAFRSGPPAAIQ